MKVNTQYLRYGISGLCCMLVGIGIARFGYTPILPLMINHHWLTTLQAGFLTGINSFGYLLGAILAKSCIKQLGCHKVVKLSLISCVLSLFLCGFPLNVYWLDTWRLIAGFSGASLMVATPTLIFPHILPQIKGRISGLIFSGVGFGAVLSGIIVPNTNKLGLNFTWFALGSITLIALLVAWFNLPGERIEIKTQPQTASLLPKLSFKTSLILLASAYCLYGIGFTPHTLFIADYIVRALHGNNHFAGLAWSLFGIGTIIGTISIGFIADRFSTSHCLIAVYLIATLTIGLVLLTQTILIAILSSFVIGLLFLSIVSLTSAQLSQLITHRDYPFFWGLMTALFALSQTASAYMISHLIINPVRYHLVFEIAFSTLIIATLFTAALNIKTR